MKQKREKLNLYYLFYLLFFLELNSYNNNRKRFNFISKSSLLLFSIHESISRTYNKRRVKERDERSLSLIYN